MTYYLSTCTVKEIFHFQQSQTKCNSWNNYSTFDKPTILMTQSNFSTYLVGTRRNDGMALWITGT